MNINLGTNAVTINGIYEPTDEVLILVLQMKLLFCVFFFLFLTFYLQVVKT